MFSFTNLVFALAAVSSAVASFEPLASHHIAARAPAHFEPLSLVPSSTLNKRVNYHQAQPLLQKSSRMMARVQGPSPAHIKLLSGYLSDLSVQVSSTHTQVSAICANKNKYTKAAMVQLVSPHLNACHQGVKDCCHHVGTIPTAPSPPTPSGAPGGGGGSIPSCSGELSQIIYELEAILYEIKLLIAENELLALILADYIKSIDAELADLIGLSNNAVKGVQAYVQSFTTSIHADLGHLGLFTTFDVLTGH